MILKELVGIKWNAKKSLKNLNPSWRYKDLNFINVLKIVTKWRKIQTSELYIFKTDRAFSIISSHFTLSQWVLSESYTFCAIRDNWKFAFSTVTSFSRQKPLKWKNKNDTIVWNKKFYHCAKFELYRIKDAKVFPSVQLRALCWPGVEHMTCLQPNEHNVRRSYDTCMLRWAYNWICKENIWSGVIYYK